MFETDRTNICVYCGSNKGRNPRYAEDAWQLGHTLAQKGMGLVYGGGRTGLMGIVAEAALSGGAKVTGVITEHLVNKEIAFEGVSELAVVKDMHARKRMMIEKSDVFVALAGGVGTLEEFAETFTWLQLHLHSKPCILLNTEGFYNPLISFLDIMTQEQFLKEEQRNSLILASTVEEVFSSLLNWQPPTIEKWIQ